MNLYDNNYNVLSLLTSDLINNSTRTSWQNKLEIHMELFFFTCIHHFAIKAWHSSERLVFFDLDLY